MRLRGPHLLLLAAAAAALAWSPARAEELPARHHALLLLRVLAYDRNVAQRAGAAATVVLLARPGDRGSEDRAEALHRALAEVSKQVVVAGLPVQAVVLPYRDAADLESRLGAIHPALLCIDGALAGEVPDVARVSRRHRVMTTGSSRTMAEAGVAVALTAGSARAVITVNLIAARAEGADLDAALLSISQVLREEAAPSRPPSPP